MRFKFLLLVLISMPALPAEEKPAVAPPEQSVPAVREQNREWLAAIARLRQQPLPGEIDHAATTIEASALFALGQDEKAKVEELVKAYDAALLQKAAQWEKELSALRAEYESKLLAYVPESRRETARAALEFSHTHWRSKDDRDLALSKEYAERISKLRGLTGEQLKSTHQAIRQWLQERRTQFAKEDQETLTKLRALLLPEEAARLKAADRDRAVKQ